MVQAAIRALTLSPSKAETTEADVVRAAQRGDQEAFGRLYDLHVREVRGFLHRINPKSPLDDLTQETFLKVWRGLPGLADPAKVRPWMFKIAVGVATDAARRARLRPGLMAPTRGNPATGDLAEVIDHEDGGAIPDGVGGGAERHIDHQRELTAALLSLSLDHRSVLLLHDLQGFTLVEIGRILGIPAGTVKSRLSHARQRTRAILEQRGIRP